MAALLTHFEKKIRAKASLLKICTADVLIRPSKITSEIAWIWVDMASLANQSSMLNLNTSNAKRNVSVFVFLGLRTDDSDHDVTPAETNAF